MRRRAFVLAAIAAATTIPRARCQERMRTVGYLSNGADASWLATRLAVMGYVEGRNLRIESRTRSQGKADALAEQLVAAAPEVLVAFGATNVDALAKATRTIPIVCGGTADPVGIGYARTLRRPGRNITGLSYGVPEVSVILVDLIRTVKPGTRRIVAFVSKDNERWREGWGRILAAFEHASGAAGIEWKLVAIAEAGDLDAALSRMDPSSETAYFVSLPQAVTNAHIAGACNRRRVASVSAGVGLARAGALMHYSIDHADPQGRVANLVMQLLRGANAADLPFELPDRTTFIVNRATARAIGVPLPPEILARATEIVG